MIRRRALHLTLPLTLVLAAVIQQELGGAQIFPALGDLPQWTFLIVFLAALGCEFIDATLGMGYGTTLTPILLIAGFEPLEIIPAILISQLAAGALASLMHHKDGNVSLTDKRVIKIVASFAVLSVVGALIGTLVAISVTTKVLTAMISAIIILVGVLVLFTSKKKINFKKWQLIGIGGVASFNKALSGGGYGPLITAGQVMSGLPARQSVAITTLAESVTCIVAVIAYSWLQDLGAFRLAWPLALGAMISVPLATVTVRSIDENSLKKGVGVATIILGVVCLIHAIS